MVEPRSAAGFRFPRPDEEVRIYLDLDERWDRDPESSVNRDGNWKRLTWREAQVAPPFAFGD